MIEFFDMEIHGTMPALDDTVAQIPNETDIKNAVYEAFLDKVSEDGFDSLTIKAATVFNRKGYANMIGLGQARNPGYSHKDDSVLVQMSVMIDPDNNSFKDMMKIDKKLDESRREATLAEKQKRLDEAKAALEKAEIAFEEAKTKLG